MLQGVAMSQLIDLTAPFDHVKRDFLSPKIKYVSHEQGGTRQGLAALWSHEKKAVIFNFLSYLVGKSRITSKDFPDGRGLASEVVRAHTHCGTHMDAPWHFGWRINGVEAKTIDQVPLEWCFSDGVVLDVRPISVDDSITVGKLKRALAKINYKIKPLDIVLILTGAGKLWGTESYLDFQPGLTSDAVNWLLDYGVKVIGIDTWGFDKPFSSMVRQYKATRDKSKLWPAHLVGRQREYCHIEKMVNLDRLPISFGFKVACFPIKVRSGSAGWVRAVAIVNSEHPKR